MERFFNTAGPCSPSDHYMLPPSERLPGVRDLIDARLYFVVHAARQTGKTTAFLELAQELTREGKYAALWATCEVGQPARGDVGWAESVIIQYLLGEASFRLPEDLRPPSDGVADPPPGSRIGTLIHRWCEACPRPVVLFLDEIDALHDESLLAVLRQVRGGYALRPQRFAQSVALIGLRDVRDYRERYRPENQSLGTASPFNVKAESVNLRNFTEEEVARLYGQHTAQTGQRFTDEALRLGFTLTGGQPWLVNALAFQVTWRDLRDRSVTVTAEHMHEAKETLIERRDTHLDHLTDKLRVPRVRRVIEPILAGVSLYPDLDDDDLRYVADLGLITLRPQVAIANPIYREVIPRALSWSTQVRIYHDTTWYVDAHSGRLDMDALMAGFADFWREHGESLLENQPYHEAAPHLVLMAFLQRIVNGGGRIHREYAVGRGRMDLHLQWPLADGGAQQEALEIKVWRDKKPDPLDQGLTQLGAYLDRLGLDEGTLAIFDRRTGAPELPERTSVSETDHQGRRIRLFRG